MAWNCHAIAQTQLRKHIASMAWGARNLISTQVKRKTLLKESKVLLELFAKTHAAKYDTDIGVLELYQDGRRIDEATLICEVIEDLDATAPALAASFVVKRRHGAAEDAVVSARSLLLQKRAPREIDDWSPRSPPVPLFATTSRLFPVVHASATVTTAPRPQRLQRLRGAF